MRPFILEVNANCAIALLVRSTCIEKYWYVVSALGTMVSRTETLSYTLFESSVNCTEYGVHRIAPQYIRYDSD